MLSDPQQGRAARVIILGLLVWLGFVLRRALHIDGVLDTDVMNFGLAAFDFDVLAHQPHPPGYPGYVVLLKLIHALAPGLGPLQVADVGALLCGTLAIPAAYWACLQVLASHGSEAPAYGRALTAAALAMVHPLLWFYGGHGQSHAAEALLVLLLFGATARVRRAPTLGRLLLLVVAFGLSGSVRPTIALLSSPMLLWAFWGRPLRDWALALPTGIAAVATWYMPLVLLTGGWDLYTRASRALVSDLFVANFSVFGAKSSVGSVLFNIKFTAYSAVLALLPILTVSRSLGQAWARAALAVIVVNIGFYALVFLSEPGYLTGVAALACLAPATWPAPPARLTRARAMLVPILSFGFMFLGPDSVSMSGAPEVFAPTYAHVAKVELLQKIYRDSVCGAAGGEPALVVSDNPVTIHMRWMSLVCPDITAALYLGSVPLKPVDAWMIFTPTSMIAVPPPVPLEGGPPATFTTTPVRWVIAAPDTDKELVRALELLAQCPATEFVADSVPEDARTELTVKIWPAACLPELRIGAHVIRIPALAAQAPGNGP